MLTIKVNVEAMEAMMYFWEASKHKEKVNERYINDLASLRPMELVYDEEFDRESVCRVLSAITNREPFAPASRQEGRFFSNNLWMLEDMALPQEMMSHIKTLNLDDLAAELNPSDVNGRTIVVYFAPLHLEPAYRFADALVLNFFRIQPDFAGGALFDGEQLGCALRRQISALLVHVQA